MHKDILVVLAGIVLMGVGAQWLAWRLKLPSILLLLLTGLIVGPVTGILRPDQVFGDLLLPMTSLSVALILFEGGLGLSLHELRQTGTTLVRLVTIGAVVTWVIASAAASFLFPWDKGLCLLFGAILIVTGPTVVGPLLRHIRPSGPSGLILKWEGIVIDPIGAMVAVLIFEGLLGPHAGVNAFALNAARTVFFGTALGVITGGFLYIFLKNEWIPDSLQASAALAAALLCYVVSNLQQSEAGLYAVTAMGVFLGNQRRAPIRHIVEFKENLVFLLLGGLFIILAARIREDQLAEMLRPENFVFLAVLVFIVRPACVWISTIGSSLSQADRFFLSWMAPRGIVAAAVASIFSLELVRVGNLPAEQLPPRVFFVIIGTVTIYGLTAPVLARRLKLSSPDPQGFLIAGCGSFARKAALALQSLGVRVTLVDTNEENVGHARAMGLDARAGTVLTPDLPEEFLLGGIGRLLALTPNPEVNALAAIYCHDEFGSKNVFLLAHESRPGNSVKPDPRSQTLFHKEATFFYLEELMAMGADVKVLEIGPATADRVAGIRKAGLPLFVVHPGGRVEVFTDDSTPSLKTGSRLICLEMS